MKLIKKQSSKIEFGQAIAAFILLLVATASAWAADSPDEIVTKLLDANAKRAAALRGYQSTRFYEVDYKGFPTGHKHATMQVRVTYQAPNKKQFEVVSEDGSKLLLNHVLHKLLETEKETNDPKARAASEMSRENYDFEFLGKESDQGKEYYKFHLKPRKDNKLLYDGDIWVDANDFAVTKISAHPAKNPSMWISHTEIEHHYNRFNSFWLPVQNRSTSKVRFGGKALLTIDYKDYKID